MKNALLFSLGVLLLAAFAPFAQAQSAKKERCLSYWTVGMSGCGGAPQKAEPAPKPEPSVAEEPQLIEPQKPQERPLAERIEEFRQNYDKPPTEFIAFNLEPSLENALRWVQKYNDMIQRSRQLSSAWSQAQQVYKVYQDQGIELPPVDYVTELPPVPDYGLPVNPAFAGAFGETKPQQEANPWRNLNQNPNITVPGQIPGGQNMDERDRNLLAMMQKLGLPPEALAGLKNPQSEMAAMAQMAQVPGMNMQAMMPNMGGGIPGLGQPQAQPQQPQQRDMRIGGGNTQQAAANDGSIRLSYYFSAQCPYCRKFEPHVSRLVRENSNVRVTCVDMTPSGQVATNVGDVDCEWRPLMPGEMDAYGVKTTPTLVIDRGGDSPLERLAGYVEYADLRRAVIKN